MANADIQGIYNQLHSGSQYTPLSANTFGDWSMEAGDLITAQKDGRSYTTPVMVAGLDWRGAGTVTVESTGKREREPLSVMSRRKYSGGGGGYWNSKKAFTKITQNDELIRLEAQKRSQDIGNVYAAIDVQAGRINLVAGADGVVTPASILIAINKDKTSTVKLSADRIELDGETVAESLAGQTIECNSITAWGTCEFKDGVEFESDATFYEGITCNTNGTPVYMNVADVEKSPDGKTLTITYVDGTSTDFSNATSLDGEWSSTYGPFRVTASPQGTTMPIYVEFIANGPSNFPIVRPAKSGANLFVISLDVGSVTGSGSNASRTVKAKAGSYEAVSQVITDYGDGYAAGARNAYPNSVTLTRYRAGAVEGSLAGKMYRKEANGSYTALGDNTSLWYEAKQNLGSSKVVHY